MNTQVESTERRRARRLDIQAQSTRTKYKVRRLYIQVENAGTESADWMFRKKGYAGENTRTESRD